MTITGKIRQNGQTVSYGKWHLPLALLLIAVVTLAVYWPALHNGFIDYDDPDYVTGNVAVLQGLSLKGLSWAFTAFHAGNWHPLTWLSHMLDIQLFGENPAGHHAISLLLHAANAVLLCALLHRLTGYLGRSVVVALLFALHPLHVESVAWVAERKDVLSTLFWLLTMAAYARYARTPSVKRYVPVAVLFALGLMAKQMLVTLPLVLLLMDYWPLNRLSKSGIKALLLEKVPLLLMSGVASLVTLRSQAAAGALSRADGQSALLSAGNALISYVKYMGKMFWPADLALFYPFEPAAVTAPAVAGAAALLAALSCGVLVQKKERPWLVFGWCWYLITLLPVIGFVRIGSQAMADRYTYIPLTGLFIICVWGGSEIAGRWRNGLRVAGGATAVALAILSVLTVRQIGYWHSSRELYDRALRVVERNWLAHNNLAILLAQQYRYDEAILHFREALRINPTLTDVYRNLGNAYQSTGNYNAALDAFREALRINPDDAEAHFRLGYAWLMAGNTDLAYREYLQLQRLNDPRAGSLLDSIRMTGGVGSQKSE
jgi:hypothetical protein